MKYSIFLSFLWITSFIYAQGEGTDLGIYESRENLRELGSTTGTGAVQTFDNRYKGVKGTPFAFEEWYPGEIFMKEKKKVKFPNLNYNVFDNHVLYKESESGQIFEVNRQLIDFFIIYGSDSMRFVPVNFPKKEERIYAELLYTGKTSLYRVYQKEFVKANYEGGYSADREYDEFVDKVNYYISFNHGETLEKLKTSKRMVKTFPSNQSQMKKYVGEFKGDQLNNADVLVKIMRHYDSL